MAEIGVDISKAKSILDAGELVAIPTETVYGLAGNSFDPEAIIKIFEVKNRPRFDPLISHIDSIDKLLKLTTSINPVVEEIINKFWPGPLTLLMEKRPEVPELLTSGLPTVAVRWPRHPLIRSLLNVIDYPLAAPSANPFGYISPTTAVHVNDQLGDKIEYILDGGDSDIGLESTIIEIKEKIRIHRAGVITEADLQPFGEVEVMQSTDRPQAPGQLSSHYSPRKKVFIGDLDQLAQGFPSDEVGILSFQKPYNARLNLILTPSGDLHEAAKNLFGYLRQLDSSDVTVILTERCPDSGIGVAINDRLTRASIKA